MLLLSSLGAPNGFPDDGPHTITAVPHMGGQSNNNQGQGTYIHMYNNTSFIPLFPLSPLTFSLFQVPQGLRSVISLILPFLSLPLHSPRTLPRVTSSKSSCPLPLTP